MHVSDGSGSAGGRLVDDIANASVCVKVAVHGKVNFDYGTVMRKDFLNVFLFDIFGEFFDDNLTEVEK